MYYLFVISLFLSPSVLGAGLMLLYRPKDISNECAFSRHLRYDIAYGMGMADTITLVFRTLSEIDYECIVEIVSESSAHIIIVVKYPTTIAINCNANKDAITVFKKSACLRLCDVVGEREQYTPYFVTVTKGRVRFRFLSNSSINSDLNANLYQVTATTARRKPSEDCFKKNETICMVNDKEYCFTSGVYCDGINNCGVSDWFDERKSECTLPNDKLGFGPVIAVVAAMLCALLAACHILLRCLPPLANSFFIFNANEDNRLCIDPVFKSPGIRPQSIEREGRASLIPVSLSSSNVSSGDEETQVIAHTLKSLSISGDPPKSAEESPTMLERPELGPVCLRRTTMRAIAKKIQMKFRKEKKAKPILDM